MGKLFWKYFFAFWLALLAIKLAVDGTVTLLRSMQRIPTLDTATALLRARVTASADLLAAGDVAAVRRLLETWRASRDAPELLVLDPSGQELLHRPLSPDDLGFARMPDKQDAPYSQWVSAPGAQRYAVFVREHEAGRLMYRTRIQLSPKYEFFSAVFVSFCFSALLAWYWAAPIRSLRWALDRVGQGRLDTRVMPRMGNRRDEVADLGAEFDRMAQRIEMLVQAQRRLMHDVSHELRSPLARLEAAIALASRRHGDILAPEMGRITREAQRLNALVGELLLLARLENGIDTLQLGRVDVMELVVAIADDAQFEARARDRDVSLFCEGKFVAEVNAEVLYRAFENVIRNAVKYTRAGTSVSVRAQATSAAIIVTVTDQGPGLSEDMLKAVFEPFRRFEYDLDIGGFGLGLAIAKHAMAAHGGSISAENNLGDGMTFTITLRRDQLDQLRRH